MNKFPNPFTPGLDFLLNYGFAQTFSFMLSVDSSSGKIIEIAIKPLRK
jgi:hypothetical protein